MCMKQLQVEAALAAAAHLGADVPESYQLEGSSKKKMPVKTSPYAPKIGLSGF